MGKRIFSSSENKSITISNDLLIAAKWPKLKIAEQRIVIWLLWKVKPEDEDYLDYIISIKEMAQLINFEEKISGNLYKEFDKATDSLMKKIIKWPSQHGNVPSSKKCHWCSFIEMIPGQGKVILRFDKSLKPFIVNLKKNFTNLGDIKILLRLKNHYSFRMYHLLKYHQGLSKYNGKTFFEIELSELKEFLCIEVDKYKKYQDFKKRILLPSLNDIEDKAGFKTVISISKRKGRKAHTLRFDWNTVNYINEDDSSDNDDVKYDPFVNILQYEFGIVQSSSLELFKQYGAEHIAPALDAAREFIENKQQAGKPITSPAGVARKAIEEGWKPSMKNYVNPAKEEEKRLKEEAARKAAEEQDQREKEEQAKAEKRAKIIYDRYVKLSDAEQEKILKAFLTDTPVFITKNYKKYGIKHPSVFWMFIPFLEKHWE